MFSQIQVLYFLLFCLGCIHALVDHADNQATILILGAGVSGLQAAKTLHDSGMDDFIIVEGADRIGGRVRSERFAGYTVSIGASWATPEGSKTDKIVKSLNLGRHTSDFDSLTIRNSTGHDLTAEAEPVWVRREKGMNKHIELREQMLENNDIPDMSVRSAMRIGDWIPQNALDRAIEWFTFDFESAEPPETFSTKRAAPITGNHINIVDYITDEGGFELILDEIAGFLNTPEYINHTRLNQKVVSIDYRNDLSVVVTCEDGTRYIGEYVLITFSIGVLQNNLIQFIPPLPEWKDVEIKKHRMAVYTHIYVSFPSKFWDDSEWILHASERRGYYPVFLNFQTEGLFPNGTPMIEFIVTGDEARRVEAQPLDTTKAEIQQVLCGMYGDSIPEATDILVSRWSQNPLTKGSFSHVPLEIPNKCRQKLQSRVSRLFFGGEATSSILHGYIAGGLDSGEREAHKMMQCLQDFKNCPKYGGTVVDASIANRLSRRAPCPCSSNTYFIQALFAILYYIFN